MGGFRIGYAIGNAEIIQALRRVKAVVDFNQYRGILNGAIAALNGDQPRLKRRLNAFKPDEMPLSMRLMRSVGQLPLLKRRCMSGQNYPNLGKINPLNFVPS